MGSFVDFNATKAQESSEHEIEQKREVGRGTNKKERDQQLKGEMRANRTKPRATSLKEAEDPDRTGLY